MVRVQRGVIGIEIGICTATVVKGIALDLRLSLREELSYGASMSRQRTIYKYRLAPVIALGYWN